MSGSYVDEREKYPTLVFTCQRESHPFQERTIILNDVIKVGRSVARVKPSTNNAIFDCKVLSRSHALIWHKNGRFWLRDTNSSNGTFVNNTRVVKKKDEEYADREIFSGDIIRFGVDVVEHDTTHGCIIAQVKLYYPNGTEVKPKDDQMAANGVAGMENVPTEQMFRLAHFINEALFRERVLENKVESMNRLLEETREISEAGWQAMLNEERLLEKLALYESELSVLKKDLPADSLQSQLYQVLEEKFSLEKASKVMLDRVLNEKTEALSKATDLESCLADSERECARLRQDCETTQEAYQSIANDLQTKVLELERLEKQLKDVDLEKGKLEAQLAEKTKDAESLEENLSVLLNAKKSVCKHAEPANLSEVGKETTPSVNGLGNVVSQNQEQLDERLSTSEAKFEHVLDSTSDGISMHLNDSVKQFNRSMQLIKALQEDLKLLSRLKSTLSREAGDNSIALKSEAEECSSDSTRSELPNELTSSDQKDEEGSDENFSAVLARAQKLVLLVTTCHARAEADLNSLIEKHRLQKQPVCNTSGDMTSSAPLRPRIPIDLADTKGEVTSPTVSSSIVQSSEPTQTDLPPQSSSAEVQSSFDNEELTNLREDLQVAQSELETYKELSEKLKEQDNIKAELLLSVREECDGLRNRIASIESEVGNSRADHQRLAAEAKRARTESEELRRERDALLEQVSTCNRQIQQLKTALTKTLLGGKNVSPDSLGVAAAGSDSILEPQVNSLVGATPHAPDPSGYSNLAGRSQHAIPTTHAPFPLFAVIPIMVLLCAAMVYIFSKFAR
ncbi:unnamed protein product [Calicophoron daubneyi]|uniref:FHA domain-containing protein n=1 Tax=Calicophoron daubneyi TaxID=300641 RepID=A0AAV2TZ47_CALDB